jgi:anaerobic magnesium-protoporphyrin IX monomethyl ester cyclase
MRVLLIYPPISIKEHYSSAIGHAGGKQILLGIYYLASYLKKSGYDVKVMDGETEALSVNRIVALAADYLPHVIGISSTSVAFHRALEVAASLKAGKHDIITIIGGHHVTSAAEHFLKFKEFDYAVLGEGEIAFCLLLDALK